MVLLRRSILPKVSIVIGLLFFGLLVLVSHQFGSTDSIKDIKLHLQSINLNSDSVSSKKKIKLFNYLQEDIESLNTVSVDEFLHGNVLTKKLFDTFFDIVIENQLYYPLQRRMSLNDNGKPTIDNVFFKKDPNEILSEDFLLNMFEFPEDFINDLKIKHLNIIDSLPKNYKPKFYSGSGYAIVGGGKYSWYSLIAVKCLRNAGAQLPVEIILPTKDDYNSLICDTLLPELNAKCVNMENIFNKKTLDKMKISGYQLKSLALLASSFKDVFLMDSDSYVVNNPENLFKSSLYKEKHMLSWPDFWRRTISPKFYEIAGINVTTEPIRHLNDIFTDINIMKLEDKENFDLFYDLNFHDRQGTLMDWSSESGQLLINKDVHFNTLLLAFYYNKDGPFGYHPLLSQGGAGEGDKETFIAAAHVLNKPFYQVYKKSDGAFGFYNHFDTWEHGAIVQYDPIKDWDNVGLIKNQIKNDIKKQGTNFKYDYSKYFIDELTASKSKPLFYHCHDPKFDPFSISERKLMFIRDSENKVTNKRRRILGHDFPRNQVDLELSLWNIANDYLCDKKLSFSIFNDKNIESFCENFMPEQLEFLEKSNFLITENYDESKFEENLSGSTDIFEEDDTKKESNEEKEDSN
ncbi:hypothetical protein C6P42_002873 [Pichia californica]|nr:hypothetical protein C6P42_002873 [[Candida] californica]